MKISPEKIKIVILAVIAVLACFGFAQNALAAAFPTTGTLISTNLLKGIPNDSIDSFFASSTIATGTSLWVQFATTSADGPWYDASSTLDATTSIPPGQQTIPLSGAITSGGANFYYKIQFNSDGSDTPVLTQIKVNYTADTYITPTTYYNLESSPAVTSTHILGTSTEQTITINNDFTVGDGTNQVTVTASSTNPTLSIGSNFTINAAGTFVAPTSSSFTIAGNWTNSGTFTHNSGTVTFNATSLGKTIRVSGSPFYDLTFAGSGGGWTFLDAATTTNNLTITQGAATSSHNMTVLGGAVTGNGILNWTGGTFLLDGTGNFGGTSDWTFYNLTFGDGSGDATTTATSSATTTISKVLTIAPSQVLNAGNNKTWVLSGSGTPFVINGTFNYQTSTFKYTATGDTYITDTDYYNLMLGPEGG